MKVTALKIIMRHLLCVFALCWIGNVAAESSPPRALSPSAPVRMEYELPDVLPASGELVLIFNLSTPVPAGQLSFEVVSSAGISIIAGANENYVLAHSTQPIAHKLKLLLSADESRFVIVQLSVDGAMGTLSRSYRVDLSLPATARSTSKSVLKMLPATTPR